MARLPFVFALSILNMSKARVLIIESEVSWRRALSRSIESDERLDLAGSVSPGSIALEKVSLVEPDLVVVGLPAAAGAVLQTLESLHQLRPRIPILAVSSHARRGAPLMLDALSRGASQFVALSPLKTDAESSPLATLGRELLPAIHSLLGGTRPAESKPPARSRTQSRNRGEILVIGASTGGPSVLATVLSTLPANFPVPIVIVQHMPGTFIKQLAERLNTTCAIAVREGVENAKLEPSTAWIAPGDIHMIVKAGTDGFRLAFDDGPPENSCRPSVDVLFRSAAATFGGRVLAVVLTGMGRDGLSGCHDIRAQGGTILVQDEATSVVWGMPGQVAQAGLADEILPLDQVSGAIIRRVMTGAPPPSP